ncbi:MAG: aldo/keto reductase [Candidatus Sumerlaeia bacterium]|nr:aldo/keto reductase [Candidatus Sumerlaeia bacterium]
MKYRELGTTGITVSEIALGTWAFASQVYGQVSEEEAHRTVHAALEQGVTVFDSAPLYGTAEKDGIAEEILGRALGSERDKVVVMSKFGRYSTDGGAPNFHAQRARESVEGSLRRLGTDRLDVLFFHSPFGPGEIHDDVWGELDRLRDEGKIRVVAHSISMFQDTCAMSLEWARQRRIGAVQVVLSLLNREASELIATMGELGVGVVARESLANGFLSGTVTRETTFGPDNLNVRYTREEIIERVDQVERLNFLVRKDITTMPMAAMRWVLDQPGISTVLTGASTAQQLKDCAQASSAAPYSPDELQKAAALHHWDYPAA